MLTVSVPNWFRQRQPVQPSTLSALAQVPESRLPHFVRESRLAMNYLQLLSPLDWRRFPDRPDQRFYADCPPLSHASFVAAYLIKLDQGLGSLGGLRQYLVDHPTLPWMLGFPLVSSSAFSWGFDAEASLADHRHFCRLLQTIPNASLQFLLDDTVRLLREALHDVAPDFGDCVAVDTKNVIAWVQENNHKAYVKDRYDKTKQPKGDPDCRLGCKRRTNQVKGKQGVESLPTPTTNPIPAKNARVAEFYWGYGSGVVSTKIDGWGEIVLAELTQTFDCSDVSYFTPLMAQVERRLGRRPRFGALDAAYDAFYIYEYFDEAGGFAAVPFVDKGGRGKRDFDENGAPLCAAGLPMVLRCNFESRKALVPHQASRYACPLRYPESSAESCPVEHKNWAKSGCTVTIAASKGARIRYQIDRESEEYRQVYKQRTAVERINSQAVDLGIERPKLRNGLSIANHNTLIYVLINLHALKRIRQRLAKRSPAGSEPERA
jgi:hypothetical protein